MKKGLIILCSLIATLYSCEPIDKGDYLIEIEAPKIARAVLIEDFTGQRCLNCPEATELIKQLAEDYGEENIIAVGIHSNPLGFAGNAKNIGLMNDEGKAYGEHWNVVSQPCGLVNRTNGLQDRSEWQTTVYNEIQKLAVVDLQLAVDCNDNELSISVEATAFADISGKLQLWITEDDITAMQMMPDGKYDSGYVHNHVFRGTVNGMWGDDIAIASGKTDTREYTYTLPADWKAENCSVVAFIYNDGGVLQVTKASILK